MHRRTPLALAGLLLVAGALGCTGGATPSDDEPAVELPLPPEGARVKVLTYNIHHGEGADGRFDLDRIARVIRRTGADLVALQEVDRRTRRSRGVDQPAEIAAALGFEHAFAEAMPYQEGSYGEAVLARDPFVSVRAIPLGAPEEQEPRVALEATVRPWGDGAPAIRFVGTHLSHESPLTRLDQVAALKTSLEGDPTPAILVGDFNFTPNTGPYRLVLEGWIDAARLAGDPADTFPAAAPDRRIDYVFVRPKDRWRVISATVVEETVASDHRPVLVELELLPAPPEVLPEP